ncbi:MAG: hypothetical protein ACRCXM_17235 [Beijerinckiaceae bacterium]
MDLHDKLKSAVLAAFPKDAPKPQFESDFSPSFVGGVAGMPVATNVLHVRFGKVHVPCGLTGAESDADLDQYAQNIIEAWKAAK